MLANQKLYHSDPHRNCTFGETIILSITSIQLVPTCLTLGGMTYWLWNRHTEFWAICSHRSLICFLRTTLTRSAALMRSLALSLASELLGRLGWGLCLWNEFVNFIQFQLTVHRSDSHPRSLELVSMKMASSLIKPLASIKAHQISNAQCKGDLNARGTRETEAQWPHGFAFDAISCHRISLF